MTLEYIIRGNEVEFAATFLDSAGLVVEPASVELTISYFNSAGTRATTTLTMGENTDGSFEALWLSSVAKKGRVFWSLRSIGPPSADQGFFELSANLANPDP